MRSRLLPLLAVAAATAAVLAGCATTPTAATSASPGSAGLTVVASTNVYGDIAATIGGSNVTVTSLISDPSQDPHAYQASARDQLAISKADVVIENGGGYDDFVGTQLSAANNTKAVVLNVVDGSGLDKTVPGFNEHVWYNPTVISGFATQLADAFAKADPAGATGYHDRATAFQKGLDPLNAAIAAAKPRLTGVGTVITEPVPLYLLQALGMNNLTPASFSSAVENGTDPAAPVLAEVTGLIGGGTVKLVVYNAQTGGPTTDAVIAAADAAKVPHLGVTEVMPAGTHYADWMLSVVNQITADVPAAS